MSERASERARQFVSACALLSLAAMDLLNRKVPHVGQNSWSMVEASAACAAPLFTSSAVGSHRRRPAP